jgi:hypothetical protein
MEFIHPVVYQVALSAGLARSTPQHVHLAYRVATALWCLPYFALALVARTNGGLDLASETRAIVIFIVQTMYYARVQLNMDLPHLPIVLLCIVMVYEIAVMKEDWFWHRLLCLLCFFALLKILYQELLERVPQVTSMGMGTALSHVQNLCLVAVCAAEINAKGYLRPFAILFLLVIPYLFPPNRPTQTVVTELLLLATPRSVPQIEEEAAPLPQIEVADLLGMEVQELMSIDQVY